MKALEAQHLLCPGNRPLPEGWLEGNFERTISYDLYNLYLFRGVGGRLTLSGLQYEDQGEYTCLAENSVGQERSPPVSLSVIGPPRVALAHIGGVQLLEGGDAVLEVEWCAAPFPRQVSTFYFCLDLSHSFVEKVCSILFLRCGCLKAEGARS